MRCSFIRDERGQNMIEMALVLPILLILFLGIIDFGFIYYYDFTINNAARAGARHAAVLPLSLGQTQDDYDSQLKNYVAERVFNTGSTQYDDLVNDDAKGGNITVSCTPSPRTSGGQIDITISYPVQIITPLPSSIISNPFPVTAHVNMRAE